MAGATVRIEGLEMALAKLREIPGLAERELDSGVTSAGQAVADDAMQRAPRDTGTLGSEEGIAIGGIEREGAVVFVKVGVTKRAFYGRFQEFGTRHMAAHPFLRPARDGKESSVRSSIGKAIAGALGRL